MLRRRKWLVLGSLLGVLIAMVLFGGDPRVERIRAGGLPLPWNSPPNHRIVYLVADDSLAADSLMAPSTLQATLGAQTVHAWDAVLAFDASAPIDALVIHDSALSAVDKEWVADAYARGVVVAFFNSYAPAVANLVQDPCIATKGFADEPYAGAFWVVVSRLLVGQPEDVALIRSSGSCPGEQVPGVRGETRQVSGRSQNTLLNTDDSTLFARTLVRHIEDIKQLKHESQNTTSTMPTTETP
jgi:hypothetical protein